MIASVNNRSCTKAPVDKAGDKPDGILITETKYLISVSKRGELNAKHVLYDLVGTFCISVV